jgi:hypothetical protein
MIYVNLFFVVLCTYILAVSEDQASVILNAVGLSLNLLVVILHLSMR